MPRFFFANGEHIDLPPNYDPAALRALANGVEQYGSLNAVGQWQKFDRLREDPNFLSLPRLERHKIFNEHARTSPDFWGQLTPDRRRIYRDYVVEASGANEQDTFSHFETPIHFKDEIGQATDSVLAEFSNAFQRSLPQVSAHIASGFANLIAEGASQLSPTSDSYLGPLHDEERAHRAAAAVSDNPTQPGMLDTLAKQAREMASDASVGAETLAPAPKVGRFGDVHGWDSFAMYLAQLAGQQVPVLGSMVAAGMIPGIGTAAAYATGAALETGSIIDDLERQGLDPEKARGTATLYGLMAGALEAMPVANFLKRTPAVAKTFKQALGQRLVNAGVQAIEEAGTEGLQTLVEQTAVDVVHATRGDLEQVSWLTPEGRRTLWDDATEAMIAGGIMGGGMGVFGGTTREKETDPALATAEAEAEAALTAAGLQPAPAAQQPPPAGPAGPSEFAVMPDEETEYGAPTEPGAPTQREMAYEMERQGAPLAEEPQIPSRTTEQQRAEEAMARRKQEKTMGESPLAKRIDRIRGDAAKRKAWESFKEASQGAEAPLPWEQTQTAFIKGEVESGRELDQKKMEEEHRKWVESAVSMGETIPEQVANQYPDISVPRSVPETRQDRASQEETEGTVETEGSDKFSVTKSTESLDEQISKATGLLSRPAIKSIMRKIDSLYEQGKYAEATRLDEMLEGHLEKWEGALSERETEFAPDVDVKKVFDGFGGEQYLAEHDRRDLAEEFVGMWNRYTGEMASIEERGVSEADVVAEGAAHTGSAEGATNVWEQTYHENVKGQLWDVGRFNLEDENLDALKKRIDALTPEQTMEMVKDSWDSKRRIHKALKTPSPARAQGSTTPQRIERMRKAFEKAQAEGKTTVPVEAIENGPATTGVEELGQGEVVESENFVKKAAKQLQDRVKQLGKMMWDTETFAKGDVYDGTYLLPREGGIQAATKTLAYKEDAEYRSKVDQAIEDIEGTIVRAERQLHILEKMSKGALQFLSEKVSGAYVANAERAWRMEAISKYKEVSEDKLGNISVREAFQNCVDAVMQAIYSGKRKRGKIDIEFLSEAGTTLPSYSSRGSGYIMRDNGIGMSDVDIRDVFLSLHSTGKDNEITTGGFGTGKAVALFPTLDATWEIHTRDNYFNHEMASAGEQIQSIEFLDGTYLKVNGGRPTMDDEAWMYIEASEIPNTTITINGQKPGNPFKGEKGETREMTHTSGSGEDAVTHKYEVTYYDKAIGGQEGVKGYYGSKLITRVVNPKTGVKLVQSIEYIYNSKVDGTMVVDITTEATPGMPTYPLDNARLRIETEAKAPIKKWLEAISDRKKQGPSEEPLNLTTKTLEEWGRFKDVAKSLEKDKNYQRLLEVIEEEFEKEGVDREKFGSLTPLLELNVDVERGYSKTKGNKAHAFYFAMFEAASRLMAARLDIELHEFRPMYLKSALDVDGQVTYAAYNAHFKQMFANPNAVREEVFETPLHFALFIKDIVDHELTHDKVQNHSERFTSELAFRTQPATRTILPSLLRMAEAYLGTREASLWREEARNSGKEIEEVILEKQVAPEVVEKVMYGQQLEFPMEYSPVGVGGIYDKLYYPQQEGEDWQLGLFDEGVAGRTRNIRGDTASPDARRRPEQPGGQSDAVAGEGGLADRPAALSKRSDEIQVGDTILVRDVPREITKVTPQENGYVRFDYEGGWVTLRTGTRVNLKGKLKRGAKRDVLAKAEEKASDVGDVKADLASLEPEYANNNPVTLSEARAAMRGWDVEHAVGGGFKFTRPGAKPLHLWWTSDIWGEMSRGEDEQKLINKLAGDYGMPVERFQELVRNGLVNSRIRGFYTNDEIMGMHVIMLNSRKAGPATMFHEAFHFAFNNVMTPAQRQRILEEYVTEEKAAKAYGELAAAKFKESKGKPLSPAERALKQMWEFFKNMAKALMPNDYVAAQEILEELYEGKVWEQPWLGRLVNKSMDPYGYFRLNEGGEIVRVAAELKNALTYDEIIKANLTMSKFEDGMEQLYKENIPPTLKGKIKDGETLLSMDLENPVRTPDPNPVVTLAPDLAVGGDGNIQDPAMVPTRQMVKEWIKEHSLRKFFDKLLPLDWFNERLTKEGIELDESMDGYLKARNFSGRAGALTKWVGNHLFQPFINKIAELDIDLRSFDEFRMALRSLELNPHLFRMHVVIPRAALQKIIKDLKEGGLRRGHKVRVPDHPMLSGKITKLVGNMATIEYMDPDSLEMESNEYNIDHVKRDALAEAEAKLKEIEDMVAEDRVPHAGMTSDVARQVLRTKREVGLINFQGDPNNKTKYSGPMMEASKLFDKIVRWKEDTLLKAGLITEEELAAWRKRGRYYAPMRGKAAPDILDYLLGGDRPPLPNVEPYGGKAWHRALQVAAKAAGYEGEIFQPNIGRGYNPGKRKAARRALGRHSLPTHSPTVELFSDALELAVRSERNRVAKTMMNTFKAVVAKGLKDADGNPLIIIDQVPKKRVYDEKTKTVKLVNDNLALNKANVYDMWIDGVHHFARSNSVEMAGLFSVLNNVGPESAPKVLRSFAAVNRFISKMATSRNPAFAIPNIMRDMTAAGIRLTTDMKDIGPGVLKQVPKNIKLLAKYARAETAGELDKLDPEIVKRIEAFKLAGGETAFWMIPRLETHLKNVNSMIDTAAKRNSRIFRWGKEVIDFLEDYNGALEGATRFAVFEKALELGYSVDKAGLAAREVTVDFTRQGELAGWLGSLYVFSNASLQGSRMVYNTLKTPGGKKWLMGLIAIGMSQALVGRAMGGEDEDDGIDYWDKITDYEKSRNLIIMLPGTKGKRLKIPMPWGFNTPMVLGTHIMDVALGRKNSWEGAAAIVSSGFSAFNPIGDNDLRELAGWYQMVAPSWLDPTTDLVLNRTFWGGPIMPGRSAFKKSEQYGIPAKDHTRYFSSASEFSKAATRGLYKYLGLDISPETLDYTISAWAGGLGDTVQKAVNMPLALATRHNLASHEIPVIRSFYATDSKFYAPQLYRANMAHYWEKAEYVRELEKKHSPEIGAYRKQWAHILALEPQIKAIEKQVKTLKSAGVAQDDPRMQKLYKRFNLLYDRVEANRRRTQKKKVSIMK